MNFVSCIFYPNFELDDRKRKKNDFSVNVTQNDTNKKTWLQTFGNLGVSEFPDDSIGRVQVVGVEDDLFQDLPDVELVADLKMGHQDAGQLPGQLRVESLDLEESSERDINHIIQRFCIRVLNPATRNLSNTNPNTEQFVCIFFLDKRFFARKSVTHDL